MAALAWIPWVPRNPWILHRLLRKCNKTRHLKYKFLLKYIGKMRNILHFLLFWGPIHPYNMKKRSRNSWIWNPKANTVKVLKDPTSASFEIFFSILNESNFYNWTRLLARVPMSHSACSLYSLNYGWNSGDALTFFTYYLGMHCSPQGTEIGFDPVN